MTGPAAMSVSSIVLCRGKSESCGAGVWARTSVALANSEKLFIPKVPLR